MDWIVTALDAAEATLRQADWFIFTEKWASLDCCWDISCIGLQSGQLTLTPTQRHMQPQRIVWRHAKIHFLFIKIQQFAIRCLPQLQTQHWPYVNPAELCFIIYSRNDFGLQQSVPLFHLWWTLFHSYGNTLAALYTHYPIAWTVKHSVFGTRVLAVL